MTTTRRAEEEARARTRRARPGHMWASGSAPPPPPASAECSWPDTFSAGRQQAAGRQAAVLHGGLFGVYLSPPGRAPAEAVTTAFSSWCFLWANRIVKAKRAGLAS